MNTIKARKLYQNPVEFPETQKLWIDCNHLPRVVGTDDATWHRIIPIPVIKTARPKLDRQLKEKLWRGRNAIVAWAVRGAVRSFEEGLGLPQSIIDLRNEFRRELDTLGQFLDDETPTSESVNSTTGTWNGLAAKP